MITSADNPKLKEARKLATRRRGGRFLAEGEDLLAAARAAGWEPAWVLERGVDVEPALLDRISTLGSGTRVLAAFEERFAPAPSGPLCVALWGVRDPGNVGTVLRAAQAFGAASVALGPDTADPFGAKAVRASMGAVFGVPVSRVRDVAELPGTAVALVARAGVALPALALAGDVTLVVGAERDGLPDAVVAACGATAHIPIATESLNAAQAATVALYERSRLQADAGPDR